MPITSSAKKAVSVASRRALENNTRKIAYKHALKVARKGLASGNAKADKLLQAAQSTLDKAVKTKLLHRNTASRLFSRLTHIAPATKPIKATRTKAKPKAKTTAKK